MKAKTKKISLDGFGSFMGRDKGCLVVRDRERTEKRYPLFDNEIGEIQIRSGNTISSGALATCSFWGIDVLVLTGKGHPVAILKSLYDDSHVETRICQYEALSNIKGLEIAKQFVLGKLEGYNQLLKKHKLKPLDSDYAKYVKALGYEDIRLLRTRLTSCESKFSRRYFSQVFALFNDSVRPERRKTFKAYDGLNNIFNLAYRILAWKVHIALTKAKLEPYLGFLHSVAFGKPSLVCDFLELYRYLMDDFVIEYARNLRAKDFVMKAEDFSSNRKGKRQYLVEKMTSEFMKKLNAHFETKIEIPRMRMGEKQEIETLINEEAFLFAQHLRNEKPMWHPRIVALS